TATPAGTDDTDPAWSPDGEKVAFASNAGGSDNIYVLDVEDAIANPVTSPTSATQTVRVTNVITDDDEDPAWSPNGDKIAFERFDSNLASPTNDIWTVDVNANGSPVAGSERQLTTDGAMGGGNNSTEDRDPVWSPDGGRIAFETDFDAVLDFDIYSMEPNDNDADGVGDDLKGIAALSGPDEADPAYSPDGEKILLASSESGDDEVYVGDANGPSPLTVGQLTNLTNDGANSFEDDVPSWQPLNADLSITKSDDADPLKVGKQLTYTIEVENEGSLTAENVVVKDFLPNGVSGVSASVVAPATGTCVVNGAGTEVTCDLGDLDPGDVVEIEVEVTAPSTAGEITNRAAVSSDTNDPNSTNDEDTQKTQIVLNRAPEADGDSVVTNEDTPVPITLTGSDPDGDTLTFSVISGPTHGTLSGTAPNLTYTPDPDYFGDDAFTFQVDDGSGGTDTAVVNIKVEPVNDDPVARNDGDPNNLGTPTNTERIQVSKNGSVEVDVLDNDSDPDGDPLTPSIVTPPGNGTATVIGTNHKKIKYTANAGFSGNDSFVYEISDGNGGTDQATVFLRVSDNSKPVAHSDSYVMDEGDVLTVPNFNADGILVNDTDPDGDTLTVNDANTATPEIDPVSGPNNGDLELDANGGFVFDLSGADDDDFNGSEAFTYRATDGDDVSNVATVTITVRSVNDAPIANPDTANTEKNESVDIAVLGNDIDPDGDPLSVQIASGPNSDPENGFAEVLDANNGGPNVIRYTPDPDFVGVDDFEYEVCDDANPALCDVALVTVNVGDTGAPTVREVTPTSGSTSVEKDVSPTILFSEEMDEQSVIDNFALTREGGDPVAADVSFDPVSNGTKAILDPDSDLDPGFTYTATVEGGPGGAADIHGNEIADDEVWIFTVNSPPEIVFLDPKNGQTVRANKPRIRAIVRDPETPNLEKSSIEVFLDGKSRGFRYNNATDIVRVKSKNFKPGSRHNVRIEATDPEGLVTTRQWAFNIKRN
ncbi:MAG: Ig-like domain-containing protein, partial [Rubrobacteraceae bacterium]